MSNQFLVRPSFGARFVAFVFAGAAILAALLAVVMFLSAMAQEEAPPPAVAAQSESLQGMVEQAERSAKAARKPESMALFIGTGFMALIALGLYALAREIKKPRVETQESLDRQKRLADDREEQREAARKTKAEDKARRLQFTAQTAARLRIGTLKVTVLGGAGWEDRVKQELTMTIDKENLYLGDPRSLQETVLPLSELSKVEVAGPGTVTRGGGFGGGGFGVDGFVVGAGVAGLLNTLTTRTTTQTLIYLRFTNSELVLLNTELDLEAMRIRLSPLYLSVARDEGALGPDVAGQLAKLAELKSQGALSDEEYALAKSKVLQ